MEYAEGGRIKEKFRQYLTEKQKFEILQRLFFYKTKTLSQRFEA
jgi:hypothetical protein